ncbi:MAG: dihydropteroate synthase [Candidatus Omnitrophica bacterium CG_4_10_14_0_2_um_filter_44_9]|nr:MAG: dihydropteroate synthase [Candidatus Omnitrophica bacterium CG_4_10_14_0_2_um_filter_44_9]
MNPYVLALEGPDRLKQEFERIGVDWRGSSIMVPKGFTRIVKISRLPSFLANILKQEMLSLGGDAALSRDSITAKVKNTDCFILGNTAQISSLIEKLKKQPFGLALISDQIKDAVANFERKVSVLDLLGKKVRFGRRTYIMGIVNVTPDSFSNDGILGADAERSFEFARNIVQAGADILDIGGESTRPGSKRILAKEEIARVLPLLKRMKGRLCVPVSIDTTKSEVAHAALDLGVGIVNDISALRFDKKMAKLIARYKACVILMHMKGKPGTMQNDPRYKNVIEEILLFLSQAVKKALDAGIAEDKIIVDPGIGFGKKVAHNLEILKRLKELKSLGRPILVGLSRKSFIGKIVNADVGQRAWGTSAAVTFAIGQGADIVRVHDVKDTKQVVLMADALSRGGNN